MMSDTSSTNKPSSSALTIGFCFFLAIAAFFLWTEHRAHLFGILPYLILLACPFVHLFMHRGHGSHGRDEREPIGQSSSPDAGGTARGAARGHRHGEPS
jgi:hypothetical protein